MTCDSTPQSIQPPVLLIAWNRPASAATLARLLKSYEVSTIFVAVDGPITNDDANLKLVTHTKNILQRELSGINNVYYLFQDQNLGVKEHIPRAVSWAFEYVESLIILEDDCRPLKQFFEYCSYYLRLYSHDFRVWNICGNNLSSKLNLGSASFFSCYFHCWGWATWKSRWTYYDHQLSGICDIHRNPLHHSIFLSPIEASHWSGFWLRMYLYDKPRSWAHRWWYTCTINSGLSLIPPINLVGNVGYGGSSSNTRRRKSYMQASPDHIEVFPTDLIVLPSRAYDTYVFRHIYGGTLLKRLFSFLIRSLTGAIKMPTLNG